MKNYPPWTQPWPSTRGASGAGELDKSILFEGQGCGNEGLDGSSGGMRIISPLYTKVSPTNLVEKVIVEEYVFDKLKNLSKRSFSKTAFSGLLVNLRLHIPKLFYYFHSLMLTMLFRKKNVHFTLF